MKIEELMPFLLTLTSKQDMKIKQILLAFKGAVEDFGLDRVLDHPSLILSVLESRNNLMLFIDSSKEKCK